MCYNYLQGILLWLVLMGAEYGIKADSLTGKILMGMNTRHAEFQWQVALWKKNITTQDYQLFCGGVILSKTWIVTAAHCLNDSDFKNYFIQVGKTNLNVMETYEKKADLSKIVIHPEWDLKKLSNDIAMMKFREPIEFNKDVGPISLPKPGMNFEDKVCIASGWGLSSKDEVQDEHIRVNPKLQRVSLGVWKDNKCDKIPMYICAGGFPEGRKGVCIRDSGGPFQCLVDGEYVLLGITSLGFSCGVPDKPDYFTRISHYHQWISNIMENE